MHYEPNGKQPTVLSALCLRHSISVPSKHLSHFVHKDQFFFLSEIFVCKLKKRKHFLTVICVLCLKSATSEGHKFSIFSLPLQSPNKHFHCRMVFISKNIIYLVSYYPLMVFYMQIIYNLFEKHLFI